MATTYTEYRVNAEVAVATRMAAVDAAIVAAGGTSTVVAVTYYGPKNELIYTIQTIT